MTLIQQFGHGRFGVDKLASRYESLEETVGDRDEAVRQLGLVPLTLGDELSDGLDELRKHKINPDKLPLKKAAVRRR